MTTGGDAYMPEGEFDECKVCDNLSQVEKNTDRIHPTTVEERLETTNLLLGHVVGRLENVAEAVQISVREAEVRHDDWQEAIRHFSEVTAKTQRTSAWVGLILVAFVTTIVSILVNLIM